MVKYSKKPAPRLAILSKGFQKKKELLDWAECAVLDLLDCKDLDNEERSLAEEARDALSRLDDYLNKERP